MNKKTITNSGKIRNCRNKLKTHEKNGHLIENQL